jgi:hypothetical protein
MLASCHRDVATEARAFAPEIPGGGPESRLWAAVAGGGQEPEQPGEMEKLGVGENNIES